ncbi:MAG: type II toxin-antitoxin system RelE/ParE family toxin [Alphaproteobacteria bacterium]
MIKSWKTAATRQFAEQRKSRFKGLDEQKAMARLQLLDAVSALAEIPSLASIGLHKLKGDHEGRWAMTVNGPWRLVFTFKNGDAYDVEIVDYH